MGRSRSSAIPARQALPAGVLAAAMVLAVSASAAGAPARLGADGPARSVVSVALAALRLEVLPSRDLDGGVLTADRPNPAPTAVSGLLVSVPTAGGYGGQDGRPASSPSVRRPSRGAGGGPRAPPAPPRPS
jgi:hypothetical protein